MVTRTMVGGVAGLLAAALFAAGCSEPTGPARVSPAPGNPGAVAVETGGGLASATSSGIVLNQVNSTLGLSGTISICVPHPVIEPLMDRLNTQAWFSSSSRKNGSENDRNRLAETIRDARLPITVELGSTTVTLGELLDVREDDVIRLDRSQEAELPIRAGKRARFLGRPGTLGGNRAVQVTGIPPALLELLDEISAPTY